MSSQEFNERVGMVAAGNINLHLNQSSESQESLVSSQRRTLDGLVEILVCEFEEDPDKVWQDVVFARVGVESADDILRSRFSEAESALQAHLDRLREQKTTTGLVHQILQVADRKKIRPQMATYCTREFGEKQLKALNRQQLQTVLIFVQDYVPQAIVESATKPEKERPHLQMLLTTYPWQFGGILLFGIIIGKFWF